MFLLETIPPVDPLRTPQLVLALVVAFAMLAIVLELVRRQKLREEYSILWIGTALVLITLALSTSILTWLSDVFQTQSLVSILYFGALVFLMLVALQFSVRLTKLTFRGKILNQRIALLEAEIAELRHLADSRTPSGANAEHAPSARARSEQTPSDPPPTEQTREIPRAPAEGRADPVKNNPTRPASRDKAP